MPLCGKTIGQHSTKHGREEETFVGEVEEGEQWSGMEDDGHGVGRRKGQSGSKRRKSQKEVVRKLRGSPAWRKT